MQRETRIGTIKKPRAEETITTETASPPKMFGDSVRPRTYKEALTDLNKGNPKNKLNKDNQALVLIETVLQHFIGLRQTTAPQTLQISGRSTHIYTHTEKWWQWLFI